MFKIIGALLIIGSSSAAGFTYAESFRKRLNQLKELQRCIYQLQTEIDYTHTPLPEALLKVSKKSAFPISKIFEDVSEFLNNNEFDNLYDAMCKAINNTESLNLTKDDLNIIIDLSKVLGTCDIEGQKKSFFLAIESLKKNIKLAEEKVTKNVKVYRYLGITFGCMIVIMLY